MGMSMHVVGIVPVDDDWQKMKDVYDTCKKAGVEVPTEVLDFFRIEDGDEPDEHGVVVDLPIGVVKEWNTEMRDGLEVDIELVPDKVKILRFYNSY